MDSIRSKLQSDLKEAMKNKETFRRDTIRFLLSAIKQVEVDERRELNQDDIFKIIQKSLKQREDAASQYKDANRDDLYEKELKEAAILKEYLPRQLSDDELEAIVQDVIKESGASCMKDMGKTMGLVLQKCEGRADGKRVNTLVKEKLS